MLHCIQQAIDPDLSLKSVLPRWPEAARDLREPSRRRRYQVERLGEDELLFE